MTTPPIHLCRGRDLPPLLHSHPRPAPAALARPVPPHLDPMGEKPGGGVWSSPGIGRPGVWRPIPRWSAWSDFCLDTLGAKRVAYQTQLLPHPATRFLVIDGTADADALYAAHPDTTSPMTRLLAAGGLGDSALARRIDWLEALAAHGAAGIYLTERGRQQTRHADNPHVRLNMWDVPSVWFARRAYRIGRTWPRPATRPIPAADRFDLAELLRLLNSPAPPPGRPPGPPAARPAG